MLKITGEGERRRWTCAWSIRQAEPTSETKVDLAVGRIVEHLAGDSGSERSTQLVFCDLSTPDPERFNVYDDVRSKLIKAGVPASEIAFIHDAETDAAKKTAFRCGERRPGPNPARIDRKDGRRDERAAAA